MGDSCARVDGAARKLGGRGVDGVGRRVGRAIRPFEAEGISLRPVTMTRAEVEDGYEGFCNRASTAALPRRSSGAGFRAGLVGAVRGREPAVRQDYGPDCAAFGRRLGA